VLDARSIQAFLDGWDRLAGVRGRRDEQPPLDADADAWSLVGSTP
jgi:hypothetical protein